MGRAGDPDKPVPHTPSITNWTDSAASNMPNSRVITTVPVRPNVPACPLNRIMMAIAPGPAINGVASGNTEGSWSGSAGRPSRRWVRR